MNTSHKWAKEITHFVNGGEVEKRLRDDDDWCLVDHLSEFQLDQEWQIRIKPREKKKKLFVAVYRSFNGDLRVCGTPIMCPGSKAQAILSDWVEIPYEDDTL